MKAIRSKNPIVKCLIGITASGKTTWSRDFVKKNPNWIRVCRDEYRYMFKDLGYCEPKIENMITELVDNTILTALSKRLNVIVDQTNVKEKYVNHFIELVKYVADIEFMIFDISYEKALDRDNDRKRKVGVKVMKRMWKNYRNFVTTFDSSTRKIQKYVPKYEENNNQLENCIIVDMDNTLSFMHQNRTPYEWHKVENDIPNDFVVNIVRQYNNNNYKIIIITGRNEVCYNETSNWLRSYEIPFDDIYMRKENDFRKDFVIKKEIYETHIKDKYNINAIFEDKTNVVKMYRNLNLPVFQLKDLYI